MTSNGFGILLILVERIKIEWRKLVKVFIEPPVGLKQRINRYDNEGREDLERNTARIENN